MGSADPLPRSAGVGGEGGGDRLPDIPPLALPIELWGLSVPEVETRDGNEVCSALVSLDAYTGYTLSCLLIHFVFIDQTFTPNDSCRSE